ncbi:hypothetical protein ACWDV4_30270 [Micromonospora sp. NPDC003197]
MSVATYPADRSLLKVHRRLRSLATMELINIPVQGVVWFVVTGLPATLPNLLGFLLFGVLLVEGAGYWLAKLHQMRTRRRGLPGARIFRAARVVNLPLLAICLAVTGYAAITEPGRNSWLGLGFALFATLEHLNYFHVQLMHDTKADLRRLWRVGLRPSHLSRDIRRPQRDHRRRLPGAAEPH